VPCLLTIEKQRERRRDTKKKKHFKEQFIGDRRFELFKRDPLANEMESLFRKSFSDNLTETEKETLSNRVEKLFRVLMKKWNCDFIRNWGEEHIPDIIKPTGYLDFMQPWSWRNSPTPFSCYTFCSVAFTVADAGEYAKKFCKKLEREFRNPRSSAWDHFERTGWIFQYLDGGYDDRGNVYIPVPPGSVPIIVDVGGLTEKSKDKVTKEIWDIVKRKIKAKRTNAKGQWKNIPAVRDPQELGFISAMKEDTFAKYLKWYDLHMGDDYTNPQGFTFRTIATLERLEKKVPEKMNAVREYLSGKKPKGMKILKGVIGEQVKGEDHVEVAVKLIYQAIHRKSYPARKKKELFKCLEHGDNCPLDCKNLRESLKAFNKKHSMRKGKMEILKYSHEIADPFGPPVPSKSRGEIIRGITKLEEQD
jgi:hypothetical protein